MNSSIDPRRKDKVNRYKPPQSQGQDAGNEDPMPDYVNILGMIFSMCALGLLFTVPASASPTRV